MQVLKMEEWRRLPKPGRCIGEIGRATSKQWEWTLTFRDQVSTTTKKSWGDVTLIMFYYLLRIGEMTMKSLRASQMDKRTVQFRQMDVTFFWKDKDGKLKQIPRNAPDWMILSADAATLKLDNQKNGWKGVCISYHSNGEGEFDPVKALARRYVGIRAHTLDQSTYLSAEFEDGVRTDVLAKDVSAGLKMAAAALDYPASRGIPIDKIDTHSLRIGGANTLSFVGYTNRQIQKMGRWMGRDVYGIHPGEFVRCFGGQPCQER
jgi:hypothetical protein